MKITGVPSDVKNHWTTKMVDEVILVRGATVKINEKIGYGYQTSPKFLTKDQLDKMIITRKNGTTLSATEYIATCTDDQLEEFLNTKYFIRTAFAKSIDLYSPGHLADILNEQL